MSGSWWLVRARSAPSGLTAAPGSGAVVATAAFAAAAIASSELAARLVAMSVCVVVVGAVGGDLLAAVASAAIAWAVLNGFLVNRLGVLTWQGRPDAVRLGVLLGAATAGWLAALSLRAVRHRRDTVRMRVRLYGDGFVSSVRRFKEASPSG